MRLKPVRFIGHKIGPFDHIELNWDINSRHTLIVAENGMGKTTLIASMAACLSFCSSKLYEPSIFDRFAYDDESFAYLEIEWRGESGGVLYPSRTSKIETNDLIKKHLDSTIFQGGNYLRQSSGLGSCKVAYSTSLKELKDTFSSRANMDVLIAAYGVNRDITNFDVQGYQDVKENLLISILNPFKTVQSSLIFQWIANQHINHALAIADNKTLEAKAYLEAIQRVERMMEDDLGLPITFEVKRNPFRLEIKQNGTVLPINQFSDGTRNFLSWSLDYLMRSSSLNWENPADNALAPGLILVDEIDSHLHPDWQRRIMSIVSQLLPETYIIATTHSPFIVGSVDDAQVFQIYRDESGKLDVKASYDELYGYPADLVLEKAFVPSLYPPEMEQKLQRLSDLASKKAAKTITADEQQEHDKLLQELAAVNTWLENLLALSQLGGSAA